METYSKKDFEDIGITNDFVQDNQSKSKKGVLRGLHYQAAPKGQAKLVRCVKGRIYDIAVDIRPKSKTFGEYVKVELSEENKFILFIPEGFDVPMSELNAEDYEKAHNHRDKAFSNLLNTIK